MFTRYQLLVLFAFCISCKSFVETTPPKSQLLGKDVFEESSTTQAALAGIYSNMRDYGILAAGSMGMRAYLSWAADEMVKHASSGQTSGEEFYFNTLIPTSYSVGDIWNLSYKAVYYANAVIEGVAGSQALKATEKDQFTGEALFIRALHHFYLVNLYGDVPYATGTDYTVNRLLSRTPSAMVYQLVVDDLLRAEELLAETPTGTERVRPDKWAVRALLARVYLYMGKWEEAETMADAVIGNTAAFGLEDELLRVFLRTSTGTIWAFRPYTDGLNTAESDFMLFSSPIPYGSSLSTSLLNAFEPGDERRTAWVGSYTEGGQTWYFPYKYKERTMTTTSLEYTIVFRLEEQYLIRAEARARREDIDGAQRDLNAIRNRAGLDDTDASTRDALLDAIVQERRIELFFEGGHRWFDLKRMGRLDAVMSAKKTSWKEMYQLWPIPEAEILSNPNMQPQNPGYQ